MHDYATSVLAFAGAARLAVHRGDLKEAEPPAHAGDAGPSVVHVRAAMARRAGTAAARQGLLGASPTSTTARHLLHEIDDVLLHRPALGTLVDEVSEFRQVVTSSAPGGSDRPVTAHPGGAAAAPVPADASHDPRDRGAAVRVPQHRQLPGQLDLSKAGRLLAQRGGATSDDDRSARRVAGSPGGVGFEGVVGVVAERHRQLRGGRDHARAARRRERRRPARRRSRRLLRPH